MELFTLFGRIATNADEANRDIDDVTDNAEKSESKMSAAFKKIGTAIATAFAVDKVIEFGKNMIETTAKIQALDSQFEQTFKGNQSEALELISKQAKEQGINVDRLKGTWASFYGTFRGNGADANQSLELTSKYMQLAADGAAYYDLSLEDVSSRLKSLVMGNFEAGDAIGVNINATKMDIKAKEEYGKAWKDLNDTEKEFLLIDTVGKIYENSGAMGQGAREANNWSNVTENLKSTWERFLSVLGSPVLSIATNVVQTLGQIIEQLTAKVQSFSVAEFIQKLSDSGGAAGALGNTINLLKDIFIILKDKFIEVVTAIVQKAQEWYLNNQDTITKIIDTFNICMTYIKDIISGAVEVIIFLWDTFGQYIFDSIAFYIQLVLDRVRNVLGIIKGVFDVITSLIKGDWNGVWEGVKTILSNALEFVVRLLIEQLLGNFIKKIGEWGSSLLGSIRNIFSNITSSVSGLVGSISSAASGILTALTKPFSGAFESITGWISKIQNAVSNIFNTYIKRPRFSFTGSLNPVNWATQGLPTLGIEWYANGGILTKPMPFGINPATGNIMAGGEPSTGGEAIMPLNKLPGIMAEAMKQIGYNQAPVLILDGQKVATILNPHNDKISGTNMKLVERGLRV
ncbi:hypothetical protein [uncultured Clostridium sp.]|uniref:phage tail protein n=1 Tax=uncultured Clostridium sp. TaxID=59620 RepID=UPI0025DF2A88|nr:hypothetical protein [uncultured Clostridium sp.]MDU4882997.1 hypothetical protein [Clostridium celatum]MDU7076102.1 hypothetical protein [Clostridium celatum]